MHAWHVCSHDSSGPPPRMNDMYKTQFDRAPFLSHKTYTKHQRVLEKKLFFSETWIATLVCMVSDKYYLNELILEQKKRKKRKWKKNEHDGTPIAELEMFE